jgi:hypothetical protein
MNAVVKLYTPASPGHTEGAQQRSPPCPRNKDGKSQITEMNEMIDAKFNESIFPANFSNKLLLVSFASGSEVTLY